METGLVALTQFAMQSAQHYGLIARPQNTDSLVSGMHIRCAIGRQTHLVVLRCIVSPRRYLGI